MAVSLSIKNVPDALAEALRERARANHRSLQQELLVLLEESVAPKRPLTPAELLASVRGQGIATEADATRWIREDREAR